MFARVRDAVKAAILSGELAAGSRLPSESDMGKQYGVSRITVRQALAELQSEGLVRTINGRGSFVSASHSRQVASPFVGVLESMRKRGHRVHARLVSHRNIVVPAAVALALDVPRGSKVGAITVVRYRDDKAFAIGTTYVDTELANRLAAENLVDQDISEVLTARLGVRVAKTRVRAQAAAATAAIARTLERKTGSPVLRILTTSFDYEDRPTTYSETQCDPEVMDYRVTLYRSGPREGA